MLKKIITNNLEGKKIMTQIISDFIDNLPDSLEDKGL